MSEQQIHWTEETKKTVLWGLNIAVLGAFLNIVCDLLLYAGPSNGAVVTDLSKLVLALGKMSDLRIWIGTGLGIVCISTWFFVLPALYFFLHPFRWLRHIVLIAFAVFIGVCLAFHVSFGFIAAFGKLVISGKLSHQAAVQQLEHSNVFIMVPTTLSILTFSIAFGVAAFSKKTALPKWSILVTPLLLCSFLLAVTGPIPAPLGGGFAMIASTTGLAIFFEFIRRCWIYTLFKNRRVSNPKRV